MKVVAIMVSSINGRVTDGSSSDIHSWTSVEDQRLFAKTLKKEKLIVMGSKTYEAGKKYRRVYPHQRRVVLTRTPQRYAKEAVLGAIEFTDRTPRQIVANTTKQGFARMLLVGGPQTNRGFFAAGLVDELWLTIEPVILGDGVPLIREGAWKKKFTLIASKKLNRRGTLLLTYAKL